MTARCMSMAALALALCVPVLAAPGEKISFGFVKLFVCSAVASVPAPGAMMLLAVAKMRSVTRASTYGMVGLRLEIILT